MLSAGLCENHCILIFLNILTLRNKKFLREGIVFPKFWFQQQALQWKFSVRFSKMNKFFILICLYIWTWLYTQLEKEALCWEAQLVLRQFRGPRGKFEDFSHLMTIGHTPPRIDSRVPKVKKASNCPSECSLSTFSEIIRISSFQKSGRIRLFAI